MSSGGEKGELINPSDLNQRDMSWAISVEGGGGGGSGRGRLRLLLHLLFGKEESTHTLPLLLPSLISSPFCTRTPRTLNVRHTHTSLCSGLRTSFWWLALPAEGK